MAITARGLVRRFGDLTAVDHIDLDIPAEQIYGFLGPNGSGKSTTIRTLLGLLSPTEGQIEVLGQPIPEAAEAVRRDIGYMTQGFSLYRDLSVQENLMFVARLHGIRGAQRRQRLAELMENYQLARYAHSRAGGLSGGERQRLALAAAVLHRPRLLVLDEPTSAVDPQNRRDFWDSLFRLVSQGTTILVSTHYMDEAERCHRLAILKRGRIASDGVPTDMMAALEGQVYSVADGDLSAIRLGLHDLPEILSVTQLGARLRVLTRQASPTQLEWLGARVAAISAGARVARADPSLEDVFVWATREHPVMPAEEGGT